MLSLKTVSRGVTYYFKQSSQQIHTSLKLLSAKDPSSSSSSSSSDSSDSDSDKEDKNLKSQVNQQTNEQKDDTSTKSKEKETLDTLLKSVRVNSESDTHQRLETLLQSIVNKTPTSASANVAIKPKKVRFEKIREQIPKKKIPYETQLVNAAKDVAKIIKGDEQKTELELLSKVLKIEKTPEKSDKKVTDKQEETPANLNDLISAMKVDRHDPRKVERVISKKVMQRFEKDNSVANSILQNKSQQFPRTEYANELKAPTAGLGIFNVLSEKEKQESLQLSTWQAMEKREIKLVTLSTPQNVFQELIQWTEQGKLWHFPINNEQGMEEETNVHFSEHVFMERHLKDWCPKRGPIRHFMELICTGLSKNPYMTVEEKVGHITWYRDYFQDKQDLLQELGVLDDKASISSSEKQKQIEA